MSFYSGVYSSCIGFTSELGESAKTLVGLSGICIGVGEVFGKCELVTLSDERNCRSIWCYRARAISIENFQCETRGVKGSVINW